MVESNYTNAQIREILGAGATAVSRWKKQYLSELEGKTPKGKALTLDQQRIQ